MNFRNAKNMGKGKGGKMGGHGTGKGGMGAPAKGQAGGVC
jgi:hypothetical protein